MKTEVTLSIKPGNFKTLDTRARAGPLFPTEAAFLLGAEPGSHFQLPQREEIDTMAAFRRGVFPPPKRIASNCQQDSATKAQSIRCTTA